MMFSCPQMYSTTDYLCSIDNDKLQLCRQECVTKDTIPCDETVFEQCCIIMEENGWDFPKSVVEACELYVNLRTEILLGL